MQEQSICPECYGDISSYIDLFNIMRKDEVSKLIKSKKTNIDEADVLANFDVDLKHIFDTIGIPPTKWCCRGHITAHQDFYSYYSAK